MFKIINYNKNILKLGKKSKTNIKNIMWLLKNYYVHIK